MLLKEAFNLLVNASHFLIKQKYVITLIFIRCFVTLYNKSVL
jgi:hypothetical protein